MNITFRKIDMHAHYVKDSYNLDSGTIVTNNDMIDQFVNNNVSRVLVMYMPKGPCEDCLSENKQLKEILDKDKSSIKYVPFAILNPIRNGRKDLQEIIKDYGFKGLKLIPVLHNYEYGIDSCGELVKAAESLGVPVMLHSGWGMGASLHGIEKIVSRFKTHPIIVSHMREDDTSCPRKEHIVLLKSHPNVYADTSYAMHTDRIKQIVSEGLIERTFWADDFPWGGANVLWNSRRISDAPISKEEKAKLFFKNAECFIKKYC